MSARLIAMLCALLAGCAATPNDWSYLNPPEAASAVALPAGGVWCESQDSATFMAQTGWFVANCHTDAAAIDGLQVLGVEHFQLQDVRVWVVRARGHSGEELWIPLPDHDWI